MLNEELLCWSEICASPLWTLQSSYLLALDFKASVSELMRTLTRQNMMAVMLNTDIWDHHHRNGSSGRVRRASEPEDVPTSAQNLGEGVSEQLLGTRPVLGLHKDAMDEVACLVRGVWGKQRVGGLGGDLEYGSHGFILSPGGLFCEHLHHGAAETPAKTQVRVSFRLEFSISDPQEPHHFWILRSADQFLLDVPRSPWKHWGGCAFSISGPQLRNTICEQMRISLKWMKVKLFICKKKNWKFKKQVLNVIW